MSGHYCSSRRAHATPLDSGRPTARNSSTEDYALSHVAGAFVMSGLTGWSRRADAPGNPWPPPWSRRQEGDGGDGFRGCSVAKVQHRTPEYRRAYKAIKAAQAAGQVLWCVEPVCKHLERGGTREIAPWQRASVSHDPSGAVILGPSHLGCNLSEAASRGNRMRARSRRRLVL